ncbi:thermonuclease family protein [Lysinibacillus sp. VIII_CA]|uniref:thermonuclease family protein n=1 Tax=Lysinibacillus sp. VIII_CA TaxID=3417452 RepID=UPI003CEE6DB8
MKHTALYALSIVYSCIFLLLGGCDSTERLKKLVTDDPDLQIELESQSSNFYEEWKHLMFKPEEDYSTTSKAASNDKILLYQVFAIDGDTLQASISKKDLLQYDIPSSVLNTGIGDYVEMKVRYLLIDTPESVHPKKGEQPFGKAAANRNMELLMQDQVSIQFDEGNKVDDYGRLLAYVYVGDSLLQETLVREGYARVGYIFPQSTTKLSVLQEAEKKAQSEELRIWSIPNYVTDTGYVE